MSIYQRPLRPDELMHYGVKGQKWGVRREELRKQYLAKRAKRIHGNQTGYGRFSRGVKQGTIGAGMMAGGYAANLAGNVLRKSKNPKRAAIGRGMAVAGRLGYDAGIATSVVGGMNVMNGSARIVANQRRRRKKRR